MPPAANGGVRQRRANNNRPNYDMLHQRARSSSSSSNPYFLGAPLTKILCILWAMGSFVVIKNSSPDDEYEGGRSDYRRDGDAYDSATNLLEAAMFTWPSTWVFQSTTEAILGLSFLAYYLRRLEHELSSRRLIAWIFFLEAFSMFVKVIAFTTLDDEIAGSFVSSSSSKGPYLIVGGVLYWYKSCIPRLYPRFLSSATLGISSSEKTLPYLWAAYVLWMRGTASLFLGAIGALASATYFFLLKVSTNNNTYVPFLDVPEIIVKALPWELVAGLFLVNPSPKIYAPFLLTRPGGDVRPRRQRAPQPPPAAAAPVAMAVAVPSPEAIAQLTSMGFEEERVKEALRVSDNNVERAANVLLTAT